MTVNLCVVCQGPLTIRFIRNGFEIADCADCGHRQTTLGLAPPADVAAHIATVYGDSYFTDGGAGYVDYLAEGAMLRERGRKYGTILKHHRNGAKVLDIGAAAGFLLQGMADVGWEPVGLEPNERMASHARTELGLNVITGSLEGGVLDDERPFDAVTLIQVMGHFIDPVGALEKVRELLAPGGLVLVETWDVESRTARALKQRWHEYSPPSVLQWWSRRELQAVAQRVGLVQVDSGRMTKWIAGHHAKSLLARGGGPLAKAARLVPDGLRLPYPSEDLFWSVYVRSPERNRSV